MVTQLVRVPAPIESLVHFVEETDPADMLSATIAKLQAGVSSRALLAGAALAVTRSTDLPPGHHGGPVHPLSRIPHGDLLDLLLTDAIPKNALDDHCFLFPTFTWRAVELLGWDYAPILLRAAARYATRPPAPPAVDWYEALFQEYGLLDHPLRQ